MPYEVFIKTVDDVINFKIYLGSSSTAMADKEKKREEDIIQKFELSQERKELFRWKKKHLSKFLKGYHLVKNKTLLKNSKLKL